ncbi:MAG: GAF domain-containing protein [Anaerolineae bacterium]|nr:GAF domain-containing protein [Anaerolineae bacterium]
MSLPNSLDTGGQRTVANKKRLLGNLSLRWRLTFAFLAVALLPMLILSFTTFIMTFRISTSRVGAGVKSMATANAVTTANFLGHQLDMMRNLALSSVLREGVIAVDATYQGDPAQIRAQLVELDQQWKMASHADMIVQERLNNAMVDELRRYRQSFPESLELLVLDRYGGLVAATSYPKNLYYADHAEWLSAYNEGLGNIYVDVAAPTFDPTGVIRGLVFAVPIYAMDRTEVVGVLRATVRLQAMTDLLAYSQFVDQSGSSELLLPDNRLITLHGLAGDRLDDDLAATLRGSIDLTYQEIVYRGVLSLVACERVIKVSEDSAEITNKSVNDLNWILVGRQSRAESATLFRNQVLSTSFLALVSLAAIALVGAWAARVFLKPVHSLTTTVERIVAGELSAHAPVETRDEIGILARAFNSMTDRQRILIAELEQRVSDRTVDLDRRSTYLQASAEVGRAATSILDTDVLIRQVVELIRERFNLYYVGLFLVDSTNQWAVLHAGTGEAGRIMLARGHRLPVGEGSMIGWSIMNVQARVALEAEEDVERMVTAELPNTRSEAALPLLSRGRVLGALTVQSDQRGAFDEAALAMLQLMADQVAVALDNARLFAESQSALETARRAYGELSRQAWLELLRSNRELGFRGDNQGISRIEGPLSAEMEHALRTGDLVHIQSAPDDAVESKSVLAVPVKVHGQVIAVMDTYKPGAEGEWTTDELSLLEMLAEQLGLALESARLYQDTQRRATRERLAGEVTAHIRESLDLDAVLRAAVEQMRQTLDLEKVTVSLRLSEEEKTSNA